MKLIFIRHGDPDYRNDSLTEQGEREAKLLAPRIPKLGAKEYYVSPLGRAQRTARIAMEGLSEKPETLWWLEEFSPPTRRPDSPDKDHVPWDWYPQHWTTEDILYQEEHWTEHPVFVKAGIAEKHGKVIRELDSFLQAHGYEREGRMYKAVAANNDTIVFFCHFGLTCLVLSHLIGTSPMILWQGFISAPTSVTTVVSEERTEGNVQWRCTAFGDTSHLYAADTFPGFSGRFCECFSNADERH
ncbi:MAG: histidine phosphatase family protein [Lachnospiraceae bacterium]|nr:histidine phosphatase family protein [Lachnospiraceae bacterium]